MCAEGRQALLDSCVTRAGTGQREVWGQDKGAAPSPALALCGLCVGGARPGGLLGLAVTIEAPE